MSAPPGARANAVPPPAGWAPLPEVDARVVEALLESLVDAGVAAYAESIAPNKDRLHVDAARRDVAEAVLAAELPGLLAELGPPTDVDPFDAIVAGWDAVPAEPTWPSVEDVSPAKRAPDVGPPAVARTPPRQDEEHYVPPPPAPIPSPQGVTRWAILALAGGVFLLVGLPLLGTVPSHAASVLGALAVIGGLGTLVWRMRDRPPVDDGPDDGAVV